MIENKGTMSDQMIILQDAFLNEWKNEACLSKKDINENSAEMVFNSLNNVKHCITPGFILRRYIQCFRQDLMNNSEGADLSFNNEWSEETVETVAQQLYEEFKNKNEHRLENNNYRYGSVNIIEKDSWRGYLTDTIMPRRIPLIKIGLDLGMDTITLTKYLLSANMDSFQFRNIGDFACYYVSKSNFKYPWEKVEDLLTTYIKTIKTSNREQKEETIDKKEVLPHRFTPGDSLSIVTELDQIIKSSDHEAQKDNSVLKLMIMYESQFMPFSISSDKITIKDGYSITRSQLYSRFLQYLAVIYPEYVNENTDSMLNPFSKVRYDKYGVPKISDIMNAIFNAGEEGHLQEEKFDINQDERNIIWERHEASELGLDGKALIAQKRDRIFTRRINTFFYEYEKHANKVYKASKPLKIKDDKAKKAGKGKKADKDLKVVINPVNRNDVLILSYFFITGFVYTNSDDKRMTIREMANNGTTQLDYKIKEIVNSLINFDLFDSSYINDYFEEFEQFSFQEKVLNRFLDAFGLMPLYIALPFDRFIVSMLIHDFVFQSPRKLGEDLFNLNYKLYNSTIHETGDS